MELFNALTQSDNQVIAILSAIVLVLSGVVAFQWRHTTKNTVPLWLWERLVDRVALLIELQKKTATIIDERLKKD